MARKLSDIKRRALLCFATVGALLVVDRAWSENETPTAPKSAVVQNPFSAARSAPVPAPTKAAAPPPQRKAATYQNPFANKAAAAPVTPPILPGPTSRWRRAAPPVDEHPTAVRAAILSLDPPGEIHAYTAPPDPRRFSATPLAQPVWLAAEAQPDQPVAPIGQATFNQPAFGPNASPVFQPNPADAPEECLAHAQQAASTAHSLDELASVANLCQRGLAGNPPVELATSLRMLASWAYNRRGELLADANRQQAALEAFQMAISFDANSSVAIHNRAVTLAQQDDAALALRDFNRVIELNPGLAIAYRNRAELLALMGRMEEAISDYSRAIESLPNDAELFEARGYIWQRIGDYDRANDDYNRALSIAPEHPWILTQRGNLAAERGRYDSAIADYKLAIEINPKCADAYRSLAWLGATCPDETYRDAEQALAAAKIAAELAPPSDYLVLEALAAAQASGGEFEDAVLNQERAIQVAPPEIIGTMRQRLAHYKARQPFRSLAVLPRSTAIRPSQQPLMR